MPMYFESRAQAGKLLAEEIAKDYAGKPCAVVALTEGGVVVGAQIALKLHSVLSLLLSESVELPNEPNAIGSVSEMGDFTYNSMYTPGQIEDLMSEFRGTVEDKKRVGLSHIHQLLGKDTGISRDLLHDKNIILVSDGFSTGYSLDIAIEFLKPQIIRELVIATPVASPEAVDRMHLTGDKIYCLNVANSYLATEHYYDVHDIPAREDVVKIVEEVMRAWPLAHPTG